MADPFSSILSLTRAAVERYDMLPAGASVAVGVSGGKDSLVLLVALARLREFFPTPFSLTAITLDPVFEAAAEAIEEAILNSLAMARTVTGYHGNTRYSFTDLYLEEWERKRKDADGKGEN